jgi:hypothetical protein
MIPLLYTHRACARILSNMHISRKTSWIATNEPRSQFASNAPQPAVPTRGRLGFQAQNDEQLLLFLCTQYQLDWSFVRAALRGQLHSWLYRRRRARGLLLQLLDHGRCHCFVCQDSSVSNIKTRFVLSQIIGNHLGDCSLLTTDNVGKPLIHAST